MNNSRTKSLFQRNSNLFTALGVFGAIAVYFTQLQLETRWRRLGIVSSLTIFLLVAGAIQRNFPPESADKQPFDYAVEVLISKPSHLVFYVAFWFLVISAAAIVLRYSNTFLFLVQFSLFIGGVAAARRLVQEIDRSFTDETGRDLDITIGEGDLPVIYALYILRNALYAVIIGSGVLTLAWIWGLLSWGQLVSFQTPSLLTAILVGIPSGFAGGGVLFSWLSVAIILIHYLTKSIKQRGPGDEVSQYIEMFGYGQTDDES